ncbi:MAG TPA: MATE family efflux transporter [Membranihabitans sp.]|nr:MATE family efflux transporter [Membranihabitans sp.]
MSGLNRRIISVSIPIILGNMTQIILGIIDSAMVGSINSTLLAGSALVNNILSVPFVLGLGLSYAISPLVATANGNNEKSRSLHIAFNGFLMCTLFAIIIGVGIHLGADIVYRLRQDIAVAEVSRNYLIIMGWSTVPMLMFLALKQFTDGLEFTRTAMYLSLASIPLNAFMNYIFIFGKFGFPRYELAGAGIGTLVTRMIIFIALLWIILKSQKYAPYRENISDSFKLKKRTLQRLLKIGIPSSLQYSMESGAFAVSGIIVGWFGAIQLAAHQIAISIALLTFMVSMGLSAAGSILVGNYLGRKDLSGARAIGKRTIVMGLIYGICCAVFFTLTNTTLPYIFNDEKAVIEYAAILLIFAGIFQISDAIQAISVGLLRGLYDVRIPTIFVFIAYWVIGIPLGYFLAFHRSWEAQGMWTGLVIGLSVSAILMTTRFFRISGKASVLTLVD